jgi:glycosyltransferase involved in cell wall biosynthesis/SAM-dependent methyltransferase
MCHEFALREQVILITPPLAEEVLTEKFRQRRLKLWTSCSLEKQEKIVNSNLRVILRYLKRIIISVATPCPTDTTAIYSLTGVLTDLILPLRLKLFRKGVVWAVVVDNLVPPPGQRPGIFFYKLLTFASFRFSLILLRKADVIFVVNPIVMRGLVELGIATRKIVMTSHGLPFDEIGVAKYTVKDKTCDAVFLGRIHPAKGIHDLVEIWKRVCLIRPEARLELIGLGKLETIHVLQQHIETAGLKYNITLKGYIGGIEKFKKLQMSKLFIFPSYDESFGVALLEALASDLPVIVYDLPAYREIFPSSLLTTVPIGKIDDFAQAVINILDNIEKNKYDPTLGEARQKMLQRHVWANIVKKDYAEINLKRTDKCVKWQIFTYKDLNEINYFIVKKRLKLVLDIAPEAFGRLLDIGCSEGSLGSSVVNRCSISVGMDLDLRSLKIARQRYDHVVLGSATRLPFVSKSFETVFMLEALEHVWPDQQNCLNDIRHIMIAGGNLIMSTPSKGKLLRYVFLDPAYAITRHMHYNELETKKMLKLAGFKVVNSVSFGGILYEVINYSLAWRIAKYGSNSKFMRTILEMLQRAVMKELSNRRKELNGSTLVTFAKTA